MQRCARRSRNAYRASIGVWGAGPSGERYEHLRRAAAVPAGLHAITAMGMELVTSAAWTAGVFQFIL